MDLLKLASLKWTPNEYLKRKGESRYNSIMGYKAECIEDRYHDYFSLFSFQEWHGNSNPYKQPDINIWSNWRRINPMVIREHNNLEQKEEWSMRTIWGEVEEGVRINVYNALVNTNLWRNKNDNYSLVLDRIRNSKIPVIIAMDGGHCRKEDKIYTSAAL